MLPHYTPRLLLQASRGAVVVITSLDGGVATARVEGVIFQEERRVLVVYHLILRPRAAERTFGSSSAVTARRNGFVLCVPRPTKQSAHSFAAGFRSQFANESTGGGALSACAIRQRLMMDRVWHASWLQPSVAVPHHFVIITYLLYVARNPYDRVLPL